ncbi:unnamed protein product [Cylindrotheca closterium]|uniref:Uncharacterized protein n=1 Tax=Cylindrotheca closterium TaxID=2856 RepID=A0AAD2FM65_9STRA|nr:unnamed protein product [Cylindrotheca closterium]
MANECACRTLKKTTQRALRDWIEVEGLRRFCSTQFQLEYPRLRADIWADIKQGPCVSAEGNKYVAVYAAACQWARSYALKKESEVSNSLKELFPDIGFPRVLRPDDFEESQIRSRFQYILASLIILIKILLKIVFVKQQKFKRISNCVIGLDPVLILVDLCVLHVPLHCGKVLQLSSVIPLSREERDSTDIKDLKKRFTEDLHNCLKNSDPIKIDDLQDPLGAYKADEKYIRPLHMNANTPHFEQYEDDEMLQHEELFEEAPSEEDDQVEFDKYVGVKIWKNENGINKFGVVCGRKIRADGLMVGSYHEKPVLDTSIYEIEWHDGETESYCANKVIEAMMMNVDDDSNSILHVKGFIDHRTDGTRVHADDGFFMVKNKKVPRRTTKGWYLCAQIHGDETEWIDLKTAKEAYPIQVAEYAVANKLVSQPAFSWWVPYTLKKRDRILKAVKFGFELPGSGPKDVRHAYEIDANTGSNHWGNAVGYIWIFKVHIWRNEKKRIHVNGREMISTDTTKNIARGESEKTIYFCGNHHVDDVSKNKSWILINVPATVEDERINRLNLQHVRLT